MQTYYNILLGPSTVSGQSFKHMTKQRIDTLLVDKGLVGTREKARALIMAGDVFVDGQVVDKPGKVIEESAVLEIAAPPRFVSRGGTKLEHALQKFSVDVSGLVCVDIGASTGGFTDCLLQHGAKSVYAIDVGYGQLDYRLRIDSRVVVLERTNIRYLGTLPELCDLATIDVSFISLQKVLLPARQLLKDDGEIIALVKPQFEAGRALVGKGGVVKDSEVHVDVLRRMAHWAIGNGFTIQGLTPSPIKGPAGNREFLMLLAFQGENLDVDISAAKVVNNNETCVVREKSEGGN